jgi:hypothetical protein
MSEVRFRIVCRGELAPGKDREAVRANLQNATGFDAARVERLLSASTTVITTGLDKATAERYLDYLNGTGAVFYREAPPPEPEEASPGGNDHPAPAAMLQVVCPKCGTSQPSSLSCRSCGVIYAKNKPTRKAASETYSAMERRPWLLIALVSACLFLLLVMSLFGWRRSSREAPRRPTAAVTPTRYGTEHLMGGAIQDGVLSLQGTVSVLAGAPGVAPHNQADRMIAGNCSPGTAAYGDISHGH